MLCKLMPMAFLIIKNKASGYCRSGTISMAKLSSTFISGSLDHIIGVLSHYWTCCFFKMGKETVRRWYHWYSPEDTPEERRLVLKLDLLIIPYAFVVYWVKYIDQTNISEKESLISRSVLMLFRQCLRFWTFRRTQLPR